MIFIWFWIRNYRSSLKMLFTNIEYKSLIFLNSRAARFISGHNLFVDYGYVASVEAGQRVGLL